MEASDEQWLRSIFTHRASRLGVAPSRDAWSVAVRCGMRRAKPAFALCDHAMRCGNGANALRCTRTGAPECVPRSVVGHSTQTSCAGSTVAQRTMRRLSGDALLSERTSNEDAEEELKARFSRRRDGGSAHTRERGMRAGGALIPPAIASGLSDSCFPHPSGYPSM